MPGKANCTPDEWRMYQLFWYWAHRDARLAYGRKWKRTNRERHLSANRAWNRLHPEARRQHAKRYRHAHPERVAARKSQYMRAAIARHYADFAGDGCPDALIPGWTRRNGTSLRGTAAWVREQRAKGVAI